MLSQPGIENWKNKTLWTGDNLPIMRGMNSESVDLIYLDPPFNSNSNYAAPIGSEAAGVEFKDTWTLKDIDIEWLDLIKNRHDSLYRLIQAVLSDSDKSYLIYLAPRLIEMRRILKDTGSIYFHCDMTMSHYLKLMMDCIFGKRNFCNEIVWHYFKPHSSKRSYPKNYDSILYYVKNINAIYTFNFNETLVEYDEKAKKRYDRIDEDGRRYKIYNNRDGTVRKAYMKNGKPENVYKIPFVQGTSHENTGYPTQKPLVLLERIIKVSSNPEDMVFDPFCGCATTLVAAEVMAYPRQWIGIDVSPKAGELVVKRIEKIQGIFKNIIHRDDIPKRTDLGNIPKYNSQENKIQLYGEQAGICNGCKTHFMIQHLQIDHVIARGSDHIDNLQLLCSHCNSIKGNRGMEYLMKELRT